MSEPGTPSRTDTAFSFATSKAEYTRRLKKLLGPDYTVYIVWKKFPLCLWSVTASKDGQYANWTMVDEDFNYNDDELMEKFITPAKGVFR